MNISCRLYDFVAYNDEPKITEDGMEPKKFAIQMFGKDAAGKTYSIIVRNFKPFFFIKVPDEKKWNRYSVSSFIKILKSKCGGGISSSELIDRQKLYGFDS